MKKLACIVIGMMMVGCVAMSDDDLEVASDQTELAASCWGQATAVFASTGVQGEHASQQANPRAGLRNLARQLYDAGVIADDSMAALGQFVTGILGLSIDACM